MAKKEMLARILSNLIQNAYEACLEASTSCQVTLAATCSGPQGPVTIHVQDNGPGFLKTPFDQYFERGFSLKHSKEPRGLGLYFAQKHVQSWGGNISLQNTDRGARASVDLAVR
jgi:sensor histidine kinase regulating citrate/malate metabolism